METIVHLLTEKKNFKLIYFTWWRKTKTFTSFISRLCGVPTMRQTTRETSACMLTIGKILEENLRCTPTIRSSVRIGKLRTSYPCSQMDVIVNIIVNTRMDGKNKNTIHITLRQILAAKQPVVTNNIALTGTMTMTRDIRRVSGLRSFLVTEEWLSALITTFPITLILR